jgi:hypothetical protein
MPAVRICETIPEKAVIRSGRFRTFPPTLRGVIPKQRAVLPAER